MAPREMVCLFYSAGKDGYTYVYGVSNSAGGTNSQVLASGTTTASAWMLSQIEDRFGNTLLVAIIPWKPELRYRPRLPGLRRVPVRPRSTT